MWLVVIILLRGLFVCVNFVIIVVGNWLIVINDFVVINKCFEFWFLSMMYCCRIWLIFICFSCLNLDSFGEILWICCLMICMIILLLVIMLRILVRVLLVVISIWRLWLSFWIFWLDRKYLVIFFFYIYVLLCYSI